MTGFEGAGDFDSDDPWDRHAAHQAAKGNPVSAPMPERLAHPSNQCSNCGADFTSVAGFDYHRVGKHEYLFAEGLRMSPPREDGRRCLDASELTAKNFTQDAKGRWYSLKARQATLAHFTAARASREANRGADDE